MRMHGSNDGFKTKHEKGWLLSWFRAWDLNDFRFLRNSILLSGAVDFRESLDTKISGSIPSRARLILQLWLPPRDKHVSPCQLFPNDNK